MATYVGITDSQTDPDAPLTSELGKAWTDNVLAMFEGASGAPRLHGDAAARPNDGLSVATVSAADTFLANSETLGIVGGTSTTGGSVAVAVTYTIDLYTGSMRFKASHRSDDGTSTSTLSFYKNGGLVTSFTTTSSTAVERTVDSTLVPTDTFEWRHQRTAGSGNSIFSNSSVTADDPYVSQSLFIRATNK